MPCKSSHLSVLLSPLSADMVGSLSSFSPLSSTSPLPLLFSPHSSPSPSPPSPLFPSLFPSLPPSPFPPCPSPFSRFLCQRAQCKQTVKMASTARFFRTSRVFIYANSEPILLHSLLSLAGDPLPLPPSPVPPSPFIPSFLSPFSICPYSNPPHLSLSPLFPPLRLLYLLPLPLLSPFSPPFLSSLFFFYSDFLTLFLFASLSLPFFTFFHFPFLPPLGQAL